MIITRIICFSGMYSALWMFRRRINGIKFHFLLIRSIDYVMLYPEGINVAQSSPT